MARRGEQLREHILRTAKDVFLELGFERTSMDIVAARAETSKRTLYAHFENKDKLFLAVFDLVRDLYLGRIKTPDAYSDDTTEAIVLYCGRFLQLRLWEPALRAFRLVIAEAERLPRASAQFFDAIFDTTHERLAAFLSQRYGLPAPESTDIAQKLLGRTVYPRLFAALLGVEKPLPELRDEATVATVGAEIDLEPIREAVAALLPSSRAVPRE